MAVVFLIVIILGLIAVLLSWENDKLKKDFLLERKEQEDRIYMLAAISDFRAKIAYIADAEKLTDIIISTLRNFLDYSVASVFVVKDEVLVFNIYVQEQVGSDYIDRIEKSSLSSLAEFLKNLPVKIERHFYGQPLNYAAKSTYSSSFHIPLIVQNKVAALVHLSSTKENLYNDKNLEILYKLTEIAASSATRLREALDAKTDLSASLIGGIADGIIAAGNNDVLFVSDSARKLLGLKQADIGFFDVINVLPENFNLGSVINEVIVNNQPFTAKSIKVKNNILDIFINPISENRAAIVLRDMTEYAKKEILKEDLTNIMIHELRSPLTAIKDSAELIISTKTLEEDKKLKFLEIIHGQAKKILTRIGSILDTAKFDAGKLVLQKTKGDIDKLIKSEIQIFLPQAERKNISLSFAVAAKSLPEISFDEIRISQVIDNLLSNSLKFTPEGGKIKIEIDYKAIEEFLTLDKYVVVSVSDTGVGIAKDQQKFLFSKYTQAQNTPQHLTKLGTGLGLYMVKGIIESHGGRVWVKSAPGVGTTISFALPAQESKRNYQPLPARALAKEGLSKLSQTVN